MTDYSRFDRQLRTVYPLKKMAIRIRIPREIGSYNQTINLYTCVYEDYAEVYELCKILTIPELTLTNTGSSYPTITITNNTNLGTGYNQDLNKLLFSWIFYPTTRSLDVTTVDYTDGRGNGVLIASPTLCINLRNSAINTQPLAGVQLLILGRTKRISLAEYNSLTDE
jgi:hypothetical protein